MNGKYGGQLGHRRIRGIRQILFSHVHGQTDMHARLAHSHDIPSIEITVGNTTHLEVLEGWA